MTSFEHYEAAARHLVGFGGHGGNTQHGRHLCAVALKAIHRSHGALGARYYRLALKAISGQLPVKCPR